MPLTFPSTVVSFSSEDPNHPASNLLSRDTYRKWKTKGVGEQSAFVILKFDKAVQITGVDIGNDASAMVQILCGRSTGTEVDTDAGQFQVLLTSSVLMSPTDCRSLNNGNGVRSYNVRSFDKENAAQKWDLVKIVVSQIFNAHTQFGLSFVKFTAAPEPEAGGEGGSKIGMFSMRKALGAMGRDEEDEDMEDDDDESSPPARIGTMFMKSLASKQQSDASKNKATNDAIRQVTSTLSSASQSKDDKKVKEALSKVKIASSPMSSSPAHSSSGKIPSRNALAKSDLPSKSSSPSSSKTGTPSTPTQSSSKQGKDVAKPKLKISGQPGSIAGRRVSDSGDKPRKPFEKLFEDVVFVISGIQNPYRASLRNRATAMGAKYKNDWDSSCTHLICAFVNTPKFREVRAAGNGRIVRKEWIERCFAARCRFPWRRFVLDRNDMGEASEEEIIADDDDDEHQVEEEQEEQGGSSPNDASSSGNNNNKRKRKIKDDEDDEDDESGNDDNGNGTIGHAARKKALPLKDEVDEDCNSNSGGDNKNNDDAGEEEEKLYEADTDVDDEEEEEGLAKDNGLLGKKKGINEKDDEDSDSDTDFEEDGDGNQSSSTKKSSHNNDEDDDDERSFFLKSTFYLSFPKDQQGLEAKKLRSIIASLKGKVVEELTEDVDYLITKDKEWGEEFSEALSDNPNLIVVNSEWILQNESADSKVYCDDYMLTP